MPDYPNISAANSYLFTRYDSTVLDAKPANAPTLMRPDGEAAAPPPGGATDAATAAPPPAPPAETVTWERLNPLALGHVINHPPPGRAPNVAPFLLDVPSAGLPPHLAQLVPVVAYPPPPSAVARRRGHPAEAHGEARGRQRGARRVRHTVAGGEEVGGGNARGAAGKPVAAVREEFGVHARGGGPGEGVPAHHAGGEGGEHPRGWGEATGQSAAAGVERRGRERHGGESGGNTDEQQHHGQHGCPDPQSHRPRTARQ